MLDVLRLEASQKLDSARKAKLGQFLTPSCIAMFMAGLFQDTFHGTARLLDTGAGIGTLTAAFLDRVGKGELQLEGVHITAYEIDKLLLGHLENTLASYASKPGLCINILEKDFIEHAVDLIQFYQKERFTHAILNPPYKKINSKSLHRGLLRQVGVETVNLYSAFLALVILLMKPAGQIVAIIPRSFCNGTYYRPFRRLLLTKTAIKHIHLFESRKSAFKDDDVLQENVILQLEVGGALHDITISTSTDGTFRDYVEVRYPTDQIFRLEDPELFIHIPTGGPDTLPAVFNKTLKDIGINISTGPVVDFRLVDYIEENVPRGAAPLIYSVHFENGMVKWPMDGVLNSIKVCDDTIKWLMPMGCYVVLRRFSSKEEKRRIVARVVTPESFSGEYIGFENHLNVFHNKKHGLERRLAYGLATYLNSTIVDLNFRRFSGHTQVNATDLKQMKYPSKEVLVRLGEWAMRHENGKPTQRQIDNKIERIE
jgi:tRNA1(Val) A37 N6-methylase TrmN6